MKHFFARYKVFILHLLAPLGGPWAVFFLAVVEAAAFGIPLDPLIAYYAYTDRPRVVLCILMGALGSALGSLLPYLIGYKGGEALIVKRVGRQRFAAIHERVERYGIWALVIPAMLPPPTPFKLFVLSAGVAEMSWVRFLLSVFLGRVARFTLLCVLTVMYGPQIVGLFQGAVVRHWQLALLLLAGVLSVIAIAARRRRARTAAEVEVV